MTSPSFRRLSKVAAFAAVAFVAAATLSSIGLRPTLTNQSVEHIAAFATIAVLLTIAFPERFVQVAAFVLVLAAGLELAQHLIPGRHGTWPNFLVKSAGALLGLALGRAGESVLRSGRTRGGIDPEPDART